MPGASYGFPMMGGWMGGQAEFMLVPYADFNCLKIPTKQLAMDRILDLSLLSDDLPCGYHAAKMANVCVGKTVYVAGAGAVGICAAVCAKQLLGASRVIIGDINPLRLKPLMQLDVDLVDLSQNMDLPSHIKRILGYQYVDCVIDCVGMEGHLNADMTMSKSSKSMMEMLMKICEYGGSMYVCGVYSPMAVSMMQGGMNQGQGNMMQGQSGNMQCQDGMMQGKGGMMQGGMTQDGMMQGQGGMMQGSNMYQQDMPSMPLSMPPTAPMQTLSMQDVSMKRNCHHCSTMSQEQCMHAGCMMFPLGLCFTKGITISCGPCPVGRYNFELMMCILQGNFTVYRFLNMKVIGLEDAPTAYSLLDKHSIHKFVIDPHRMIRDYYRQPPVGAEFH